MPAFIDTGNSESVEFTREWRAGYLRATYVSLDFRRLWRDGTNIGLQEGHLRRWRGATEYRRPASRGKLNRKFLIMQLCHIYINLKLLEDLLDTPRWSNFSTQWSTQDREDLTFAWHRLDGQFRPMLSLFVVL